MLKITFSSTFSLIPLQTSSLLLHEGHRLKLTIWHFEKHECPLTWSRLRVLLLLCCDERLPPANETSSHYLFFLAVSKGLGLRSLCTLILCILFLAKTIDLLHSTCQAWRKRGVAKKAPAEKWMVRILAYSKHSSGSSLRFHRISHIEAHSIFCATACDWEKFTVVFARIDVDIWRSAEKMISSVSRLVLHPFSSVLDWHARVILSLPAHPTSTAEASLPRGGKLRCRVRILGFNLKTGPCSWSFVHTSPRKFDERFQIHFPPLFFWKSPLCASPAVPHAKDNSRNEGIVYVCLCLRRVIREKSHCTIFTIGSNVKIVQWDFSLIREGRRKDREVRKVGCKTPDFTAMWDERQPRTKQPSSMDGNKPWTWGRGEGLARSRCRLGGGTVETGFGGWVNSATPSFCIHAPGRSHAPGAWTQKRGGGWVHRERERH